MFHLVWIPKYRKRILDGEVAKRLKSLFYEGCKFNDWWIDELEILTDHVHMLIQIRPTDSVSNVVKVLKGGTSKVIRKEFPDLEEFLWGENFWATGYFAESVGGVNYADVKKYIKEQNTRP